MKKTKIICTIGPACSDIKTIREMIGAGMNVARLNMSHGDHSTHADYITLLKQAREKMNVPLGILIDTKGPEFRIKQFENGKVNLVAGQTFTLTTSNIIGNENMVSITYKPLPSLVSQGDKILLNDGFIVLEVEGVTKYDIVTKVVEGGVLSNNKSINLPDVQIDMPFLNDADKSDLLFAIDNDVDFLALSFVRSPDDVKVVKRFLRDNGGKDKHIRLIAKIENQQGINNIDQILDEADGIMVARGGLGVELEMKQVPILQKLIVNKCNEVGKIAIVATEMLESMVNNTRPTRAELTDVANAVLDGATAVMLSAETAVGKNVVRVIEYMSDIIIESEKSFNVKPCVIRDIDKTNVSKSISFACRSLADQLSPRAIIVVTLSGASAFDVAEFRPNATIIACTISVKTFHQLSLCWGTTPVFMQLESSTEDLLNAAKKTALKTKLVTKGDLVIQTAGLPLEDTPTNLLRIDTL